MKKTLTVILLLLLALAFAGCAPRISLMGDYSDPLKESWVGGKGEDKIAIIPIAGKISEKPRGLLSTSPSLLEETVAALNVAREDKSVKAVILKLDSPGGEVTASDVLYHEVKRFRKESGKPVLALLGDQATSGAYYIAVAADAIVAHPTTVTGSIGVIFITGNLSGLMEKIGVEAKILKTGKYKDILIPTRRMTEDEEKLFQAILDSMHERFVTRVIEGRPMMAPERIRELANGMAYTADQALKEKLIDKIGFIEDAVAETGRLAKLGPDPRLVVYRRAERANDTVYNAKVSGGPGALNLLDLGGLDALSMLNQAGFYYLWQPATTDAP